MQTHDAKKESKIQWHRKQRRTRLQNILAHFSGSFWLVPRVWTLFAGIIAYDEITRSVTRLVLILLELPLLRPLPFLLLQFARVEFGAPFQISKLLRTLLTALYHPPVPVAALLHISIRMLRSWLDLAAASVSG
jgi:hypothetical protein